MVRYTQTALVINFMERYGDETNKAIYSEELQAMFFPDLQAGKIWKKERSDSDRRASTWEIKILFEEFILELKKED